MYNVKFMSIKKSSIEHKKTPALIDITRVQAYIILLYYSDEITYGLYRNAGKRD